MVSFWCWLIGFYLAFMPLYVLGLLGMTRRMQHYANTDLAALFDRRGGRRGRHSLRHRRDHRAAGGQHPHARAPSRPHRRSLERQNPGVVHRFAAAALQLRRHAAVESLDAFWVMKQRGPRRAA